ncbi:MAG: hypothetical protein M3Y85_12080 [Bacteroidota bacterium]|nr:hypothetical protein [Bacteroidota bacterium]
MKHFISLLYFLVLVGFLQAQDTLPKYSVKNLGADPSGNPRIIISWVNQYDSLNQISIQTSHDSLKNYRTIISLTDPNARMNGFADTKAVNDHMFYRLFIVRSNGQYFFSGIKKPVIDTAKAVPILKEPPVVKKPENAIAKKPDFVPSFYVYTNKDGYTFINLPDAEKQKYRVKFFEEDGSFLFEIKSIQQPALTIDKTNFVHAGWFLFELYNEDKLLEKNKFYLAKEF